MKKNAALPCAIVMSIVGLSACSTTANLYPVEGPLSRENPVPTVVVKVDGITSNTGGFNLLMPDGAICTGRWSSVAPQYAATTTTSLFSRYGTVTGYGTTVGIVPGVNKGQAFATCSDNTRLEVEFYTGSGTANGYGIAKDTNGNVYKMIF